MKTILSLLLLMTSLGVKADLREFPITNREGFREICRAPRNEALNRSVSRSLEQIRNSYNCGDMQSASAQAARLSLVLKEAARNTPVGWCYDIKGCPAKGHQVYGYVIDKSKCDAAGGKSWMQTDPNIGTNCTNFR